MEGNWNGAAGNNKIQYNGKEWNDDFGLGWSDYGARFYDPAIARWGAVDPLSEKYNKWSPYNYTMNNPVKYIDPNGKDIIITIAGGQNLPKDQKFESVKYGGDGKLYDVISGKEYTGTNSYFRETQSTLNKLSGMGGEVKEVVDDLLKSGDTHTIAMNNGLPSKDDPTGAKGSYTVRDGGQSSNTFTRFVPKKDKANGLTFSETEILGHEMKHAFNIKNKKDNSKLTVIDDNQKTSNGTPKKVTGEEVDATNFQNVIRDNEGKLPQTTYQGVDISSKLVNPCDYKVKN